MLTFLAEQGLVNLDHLPDSANLGKLGRKAKDEMENYFPEKFCPKSSCFVVDYLYLLS